MFSWNPQEPEKPVWNQSGAAYKVSAGFSSGQEISVTPTYTAGALRRREGDKDPEMVTARVTICLFSEENH